MIKIKHLIVEQKSKEDLLLEYIKDTIKGTKFEGKTFVAGGWVRDLVMGKKSKDIDITVALPNGGINFSIWITKKDGSYKENSNPVLFPNFGTSKFNLKNAYYDGEYLGDIDIEAVMTRKEQYHEGDRKPDTEFGTIYQDVERRDLTINSLLYDISNQKILDLTGKGLKDIKSKTIRTPINADIIFKEDALRMLRCIRFSTKFGWKLSDDMMKSLTQNAKMLETISEERIQEELNKILLSDNAVKGIKYLMNTNLMRYIIPEYYYLVGMQQNKYHQFDAFEHSMKVLEKSPKRLEVRLGALLHDIGKIKSKTNIDGKIQFLGHEVASAEMTDEILKRLKYSGDIINKVKAIVGGHMKTKQYGKDAELVADKTLRRLMNDMGDNLESLLQLIHADNSSHGEIGWEHNMENQVDSIRIRLKQLGNFTGKLNIPIDGNKIMALLNIKPGRDIGIIMRKIKDLFLDDPNKINNMNDAEIEILIKDIYNDIKKNEGFIKLKSLIQEKKIG